MDTVKELRTRNAARLAANRFESNATRKPHPRNTLSAAGLNRPVPRARSSLTGPVRLFQLYLISRCHPWLFPGLPAALTAPREHQVA